MKNKKGQILLITIMLVATLLTVVLAVTFRSTTETQLTKLEEESQKALAAAEAGVEAALQNNIGSSVDISSLSAMVGTNFTGAATVGTLTAPTFVSPLLQKDQQYTFYLSNYPGFTSPLNGNIQLYFMSESSCPTLELTLVSTTNVVSRRLADPCNQVEKPTEDLISDRVDLAVDGYNFVFRTDPIPVNHKVLIARSLFASTRIAMERIGGGNLPVQGKYVTSEAKSPAGVSKKVRLFQSFPQIPAEFFVTSF